MSSSPLSMAQPTEDTFERLGRITRHLHEAMTQLGLDKSLHAITQEFPDARDRLSHVGHMTEAAGDQGVNLIDGASQIATHSRRVARILPRRHRRWRNP